MRTVQNDDFSQAWPRQIDLSPSFCFRPTGPTTVLIPAHETCSEKEKKRPLSHATILFIRKIKCSKKKSGKKRPHVANAYAVACKAPDTGANGCLGKETAPTPVRSPAPLLCRRRTPRPGPAPATDRAAVSPPPPRRAINDFRGTARPTLHRDAAAGRGHARPRVPLVRRRNAAAGARHGVLRQCVEGRAETAGICGGGCSFVVRRQSDTFAS